MTILRSALSLSLVAIGALGFSLTAHAQHYGDYWDGGSGTWNTTNANWDGNNVYYNSNNRTDIATPVFSGTGGTVTVDESGGTLYNGIMVFNSGNWTFNGDPLYSISTDYQAQVVVMNPGSGNVTINNTINIAPNPTNGGSYIQNESTGTTLTLGGINISSIPQSGTDGNGTPYTNQSAPFQFNHGGTNVSTINTQTIALQATNGATIVVNGNYTTDPNLYGGMLIGSYNDASSATGTYIFNGSLNENSGAAGSKLMDFGSGNIIFNTSNTDPSYNIAYVTNQQAGGGSILTEGTQTIGNGIYSQNTSFAQIGAGDGSTATYTGQISAGSGRGTLDLHAGTGGTATFTQSIVGDNNATTKSGTGTVILGSSTGNNWTTYIPDAFEMKAGTTVIENTSGDAFGNGVAYVNVNNTSTPAFTGSPFVQLDAGAKLAGIGSTTKMLNAMGATSEISPGLSNQIGSLYLGGGLTATSGLIMDFKLNGDSGGGAPVLGVNSDFIHMADLTLGGVVTINLSAMDALLTGTGNDYILFSTDNDVTENSDLTYDVIAPTGYALDTTYGTPDGLNDGKDLGYEDNDGTFSVQLVATPEPSTYGLMGLGLLALVGISRWIRRGQST